MKLLAAMREDSCMQAEVVARTAATAAEPSLAVTALMALNMALVQQGNPTGNSIPTLSTDTGERQLRWRP